MKIRINMLEFIAVHTVYALYQENKILLEYLTYISLLFTFTFHLIGAYHRAS